MMLNVETINVYYGAIHAIKDVSFHVEEGEIVTLIGANGAGKSTILKTISGLLHTKTGGMEFLGRPLGGDQAPQDRGDGPGPCARGAPGVHPDVGGGEPGDGRLHPAQE